MQQTLNCRGRLVRLDQPKVMGIVNVTIDSFYAKSRVGLKSETLALVAEHLEAGADIIDVGAMSTRPGASELSIEEEQKTLVEAINLIKAAHPDIILSADTYRSAVAESALQAGADIINDVGGGLFDEQMFDVVGAYKAPYILMHNRAKSAEMQQHTDYENLIKEILEFLYAQKDKAQTSGITDIILDPGFGFSKTIDQNFELLDRLDELLSLDLPLLVGLSRKSFIYKTLKSSPSEALNGTTAMHMLALDRGAKILRVHDVKEACECVHLYEAMKKG